MLVLPYLQFHFQFLAFSSVIPISSTIYCMFVLVYDFIECFQLVHPLLQFHNQLPAFLSVFLISPSIKCQFIHVSILKQLPAYSSLMKFKKQFPACSSCFPFKNKLPTCSILDLFDCDIITFQEILNHIIICINKNKVRKSTYIIIFT